MNWVFTHTHSVAAAYIAVFNYFFENSLIKAKKFGGFFHLRVISVVFKHYKFSLRTIVPLKPVISTFRLKQIYCLQLRLY